MVGTVLDNAYLIRCESIAAALPSDEPDARRYGSVSVQQRPLSRAGELQIVENENYTLLLRGHVYCEAAGSLEPAENLKLLLKVINERSTLVEGLSIVAGGMFTLFVVDHRRSLLHVTTDRLGFMPCYYRRGANEVAFTNNQFLFQRDAALSEVAVCEYLKYGHLPFTPSLFESVGRILPGQIVTVTQRPELRVNVETRQHRTFLPLAERIQNPAEGAEVLAAAFDKYFSRLGTERGTAGLSGGYDSRVIAAYTAERDVSLFNFGNPGSREVVIAKQVAARIGRPLDCFRIPDDAVSLHGGRFKTQMLIPDSFEHAHVFELVDRVAAAKVPYHTDGFIGDSVVGSGYYYSLGKRPRELVANLRLKNCYESPVKGISAYVDLLYGNKRAVPDSALLGLIDADVRDSIRGAAQRFVESHMPWCPTHEDMAESLTHATRGRCLIAGGPVAVSAFALCACPFIDNGVFDAAMSCAKAVKAGDRLYNAFWRHRFPALADIPKGNTGGRPRDRDSKYRLKHTFNAVLRRSVYPRLKRLTFGQWDRTDNYSTLEGYLACPANKTYLRELQERSASFLPPRVAAALMSAYTQGTLTPAVSLRLGTLMAYSG